MKINLDNKTVWQIGSGNDSRNYANVFFKFGVALVGPGKFGKHGEDETYRFYKENSHIKDWGAEIAKVKQGDWIILRKGRKQILGIGEVVSSYGYSQMFEDVEGWDLQHYVEVKWFKPYENIVFKGLPLAMTTLAYCSNNIVLERIKDTDFISVEKEEELKFNKDLSQKLTPDKISSLFINKGIRIQDAENISLTIKRIIQLADWYFYNDYNASEHELRSFLVVPLLISLGWSEQKIKIEYKNMDVALFDLPFRPEGDNYHPCPRMIVETKKFDNGLAYTDKQVKNYGANFPDCKNFVTTNGYRYRTFIREGSNLKPTGYINLLNLREKDILNNNLKSAFESLLDMSNLISNP